MVQNCAWPPVKTVISGDDHGKLYLNKYNCTQTVWCVKLIDKKKDNDDKQVGKLFPETNNENV